MKSYAAVDSIEGSYVRCELEMLDINESRNIAFYDKEEYLMVNIPLDKVCQAVDNVTEQDILIVEHEAGVVISVYGRDDAELQRRMEEYREMKQG